MDLDKLNTITARLEQKRSAVDRAQGAMQAAFSKLCVDFGVKTVEEAQALLKKLHKEEAEAKQLYETELNRFEKRYGQLF